MIFGGLAAAIVQAVGPEKSALVLVFMPPEVILQRSAVAVIDQFVSGSGGNGWSSNVCPSCQALLAGSGWEEVEVEVNPTQDLVFHGLGWLSVRKNTITLRCLVPAGIHVSIRPHLIGPRRRSSPE